MLKFTAQVGDLLDDEDADDYFSSLEQEATVDSGESVLGIPKEDIYSYEELTPLVIDVLMTGEKKIREVRRAVMPKQPWGRVLVVLNNLVTEKKAEYLGDATYKLKERKR